MSACPLSRLRFCCSPAPSLSLIRYFQLSRVLSALFVNLTWVASLVDMAEHTSDIHMEDGDPASNDERYLPDFDGLRTASMYGDCSVTGLNTSWFDQSPEWHNDMFPQSSTNLLPMDPSLAPDGQALETDEFFISPYTIQCNYSTWTHVHTNTEFQEPVSPIIFQSVGT